MGKIIFVHAVECGDLEKKSILLCESIRQFTGSYSQSDIYAITPRKGKVVSKETQEKYSELNVKYIYADLNRKWFDYPYINTSYAANYVEKLHISNDTTIVLCDTDTIFINEPSELDLDSSTYEIAVTPLDTIATEVSVGDEKNLNEYWEKIFDMVGVDRSNLWKVKTVYEGIEVLAYFNNGIIASKPSSGLFEEMINVMERATLDSYIMSLAGGTMERFFLDQAFLGAILQKRGSTNVKLLNSNYNHPLNVNREFPIRNIQEIIHLHYHNLFYFKKSLKSFTLNKQLFDFLKERLPIKLSLIPLFIIIFKSKIPQKYRNKLRKTWIIKYLFWFGHKIGLEF